MRQMPLRALRFEPDPLSRLLTSILSLSPSMSAASSLTPPSTTDRSFCSCADRAWKCQTVLTRSCNGARQRCMRSPIMFNHDSRPPRASAGKSTQASHMASYQGLSGLTHGRGDARNFRAPLYTFCGKFCDILYLSLTVQSQAPCDAERTICVSVYHSPVSDIADLDRTFPLFSRPPRESLLLLRPTATMLTFKVILLAVSGVIFTRAISPPSRRAPGGSKGEGVYRGQAFEYLVRFLAYLVWVSTPLLSPYTLC